MSVLPVGIGSEEGGYRIERSLRFNSADSAYLNRTPSGAGTSATIWTFSWWQKGVALTGSTQVVFGAESGGARDMIRWDGSGTLEFVKASSTLIRVPTAKYRDPSAWYHFVINVSGATVGVYVNGLQVTAFSTSNNPSGNWYFNQNYLHRIGLDPTGGDALNGYLTEIHMIDGQALTPTDFGEFNSDTGVWQPKKYTGTYGTNGFYLNFSDNSGTTSTTLGADSSGNGNNWTPNNFSVTAGAGNDSLVDSPTRYGTDTGAGGEVRGNYCTLNPLSFSNATGGSVNNGNLNITSGGTNGDTRTFGTIGVSSGKWYFESTIVAVDSTYGSVGISDIVLAPTQSQSVGNWWVYISDGDKYNGPNPALGGVAYGSSYTTNDVIGVAVNLDAGEITFYKNGVSQGVAYSNVAGTIYPAIYQWAANSQQAFNFGQRPFAYTAPSGFLSICTTNLPEPTIADGGEYFNTVLWTGNGVDGRTITGVGFNPDFTWAKGRSNSGGHVLADAVRGSNANLYTNLTDAETNPITGTAGGGIGSVTTDGFVLEQGTVDMNLVNNNTQTYVAWNWKANGAGVSNTDGSITSTVSANTDSGFSIVTYTGDLSAAGSSTVGHGLGVAPQLIITKRRDGASSWPVQVPFVGQNKYLRLNETAELQDSVTNGGGTLPLPTSTTFGVTFLTGMGVSGHTHVAYCFAAIPGYSAMGSYLGNGSADGPFVYTGFRPAFILFKKSSDTDDWVIYDTARDTYNVASKNLFPNGSFAEDSNATNRSADILSNGFKLRSSGTFLNGSGATFIYAAFAENPFAYSLAR